MAARRKHKLVVEITFSQPINQRVARNAAEILIDGVDFEARPIFLSLPRLYVDKCTVKHFERVVRAKR